ncbi:MAG TPA: FAD-dependent monooxygenase, partial [Acidimicrobiales bacterium]|nr:FAD-dependent monooxygenase [Acidimicrobiales bacterium]
MYDVVVVGASVAGCATAVHFGRAGLRVALLERNRSMAAYKALCGHYVLGGARPALERLGIWDAMVRASAPTSVPSIWTGHGWAVPPASTPTAISLRRAVLDPMLRELAGATPGVDLLLGHTVTGLVEEDGQVAGVLATTHAGTEVELRGQLVVGADGHRSRVAHLAHADEDVAENARFLYWGYYDGVRLRSPGSAAVWFVDPDVAVAVPTDGDRMLLGAFPVKARLDEFEGDRLGALERFFAALPDGPDLQGATAVSKAIGTSDYAMVRRAPAPRSRLALVGDAATTSDPVP